MNVQIRFATPDDAVTIDRFVRELATFERALSAVQSSPERLRSQLMQRPPPFECLIADRGEQPVGFALFYGTYSTWEATPGLHLEDLYVTPEHRAQGIGRALLQRLASIACERGCARLEWAVLDWNQPAIDFYDDLEAKPLNDWIIYRLSGPALRRVGTETKDTA